jgi:hypothetical protein
MGIAYPVDATYNPIVRFEVFGIDCQFTANIAVMPNLERRHPILAIAQNLAHFPRLSLMYVRQLLCSPQSENTSLLPNLSLEPQTAQGSAFAPSSLSFQISTGFDFCS